ncbi:hypothetical protein Cabys_1049 [Caldithrix abyssi DSM 13497]|uniref:Uncharacterized protein n=1 Tax=Caldithrix abyssi DSM 13497 TaxID=880073 RepID=A0A1J1C5F8_CALAY|nr:hypothetical protein Cabys_1049 [Caldithrix abyssi DSM 13497]
MLFSFKRFGLKIENEISETKKIEVILLNKVQKPPLNL